MGAFLKRCDWSARLLVGLNALLVLMMVFAPSHQAYAAELHQYVSANLQNVVDTNYANNDVIEETFSLPEGYTQHGIENGTDVEDKPIISDQSQGTWNIYRNDEDKKLLALFTPNAALPEESRNLLYDTLRLEDEITGTSTPIHVLQNGTRNEVASGALLQSLGDRDSLQRWFYVVAPDTDAWSWIARISRSYLYIHDYQQYLETVDDVPTLGTAQQFGNLDFTLPGGGGTSAGGTEPTPEPAPEPESIPLPEPVEDATNPEPEPVLETPVIIPEPTTAPLTGIPESSSLAQTGDNALVVGGIVLILALASGGFILVYRLKIAKKGV